MYIRTKVPRLFINAACSLLLCLGFAGTSSAQYCSATSSGICAPSVGDYINSFSTTGGTTNITNNNTSCSAGSGNYYYYSTMSASAAPGSVMAFSFTNGGDQQWFKIWVDWNLDGDFLDTFETVYSSTSLIQAGATVAGTFTVPYYATPGASRLRVRSSFNTFNFTSCGTTQYGETEDYGFTTIAPAACSGTPTPGTASAYPSNVCFNQPSTLVLTGYPNNTGINIQWQQQVVTPASSPWMAIAGATSSTYTVSSAVSMNYRAVVACGNNTANSNAVTVNVSGMFCVDSVYPGDANHDSIANNLDLLAIAIAYGATGPVRAGATTTWIGQYCANWSTNFLSGANYKHADCDGNGTVNTADIAAVTANYGLTHAKPGSPHAKVTGFPDLYFDVAGINFTPGTTVNVPLKLGSTALPVAKLYGIAATTSVTGVAVSGMNMSFASSWIGTASNTINLTKAIDASTTAWALGRNDHHNTAGNGTIAMVSFTIPMGSTGMLTLTPQSVTLIDSAGHEITDFNIVTQSATISTTGITNTNNTIADLAIVPNPSHGQANLQGFVNENVAISISIVDITGRNIWTERKNVQAGSFNIQLPIATVAPGLYNVQVKTSTNEIKVLKLINE